MNQRQGQWEKRWHPLREEWVVYAAHRNRRYRTSRSDQLPLRQPGLQYEAEPEIGIGKFMADTMPEEKAAELKAIDESHYQPRT